MYIEHLNTGCSNSRQHLFVLARISYRRRRSTALSKAASPRSPSLLACCRTLSASGRTNAPPNTSCSCCSCDCSCCWPCSSESLSGPDVTAHSPCSARSPTVGFFQHWHEARDLLTAALLVSSGAGQEARDLTTIALRLLWRSHTKAHGQLFMIGAATREVNLKIRRTFTQGGAVMSDGRAQTKHQRTATASSGALIFGTCAARLDSQV